MFNLLKRAGGLLLGLLLFCFQFMDIGFSEEVKFSDILVSVQCSDKDEGWVYVALHDKDKTFPKKGNDAAYLSKAKISKGQVKVIFSEIPHGAYAISAFYDENGNGKLDCNFLGIPKERAGVSNNYSGLPKWEKSKFDVSSTVPLKIAIDLRG
ncbi:MAG: DUF2141 domain-containing protein [Verrucomicrobiota bacterium]|nr:DUF2141 domain-containing protein [Verrucomicrobiota bacterium]